MDRKTVPSSSQRPLPPGFHEAKNRRQRVRATGMHPDYWYAVEHDHAVKPGQTVGVRFWDKRIAIYRGEDGVLRALEDRCAHRALPLSEGQVCGCNIICPYHGWEFDGQGALVKIPHEIFSKSLPKFKVPGVPLKVRYGLIWIFPGDPKLAETRALPEIPELEGPDRWACVPVDFTFAAHHSMIIDNVSDFTHAYLHRRYRPFWDAKLTRSETVGDKVFIEYDTPVGTGKISGLFVDRDRVNTNHMELCYDYPYQRSSTGGKIKHWLFVVPIDERTTRAFFLFYFDALKIPFTSIKIPQQLMTPLLKVANQVMIRPLLAEDKWAVEAEQRGYDFYWDQPIAETNPAVGQMQALTIRKWEEHLSARQAAAGGKAAAGVQAAAAPGATADAEDEPLAEQVS